MGLLASVASVLLLIRLLLASEPLHLIRYHNNERAVACSCLINVVGVYANAPRLFIVFLQLRSTADVLTVNCRSPVNVIPLYGF